MDVDYLNFPTQLEQMDLMTVMMQMEKLSEYSELLSPSIEYSNGHSPSLYSTPPSSLYSTPPSSSPKLTGQSSPISFCQEQLPTTLHSDTPAGIPTGDAGLCYPYLDPRTTAMRDVIFHISAMQPVNTDLVSVKPVKRRNVKISKDPQSVAARHRRERISERIRVLQSIVPGGTKMDTASMLDEAIHYVKFLKAQVQTLERGAANWNQGFGLFPSPAPIAMGRTYQLTDQLLFNSMQMLS